MKRWIHNALFLIASLWVPGLASAAGLNFSAEVDRQELYEDESVQLVYSLRYEGQRADFSDLTLGFTSPDLEEVSQFDSPTFYHMSSINGVTRSETQTRVTKVLRPKRKGTISIRQIFAKLDGKTYYAQDLTLQVLPSQGQRAVRPRGYGMGGALSMSGKRGGKSPLLLRAEVSKLKAVKGEQLIVSFYAYRRGQVGQLEAIKLPDFKGFLKDDPELPVLKRPQPLGATTLDGWTYEKDLLARYVVYPLEAGTLTVDALEIRGVAYPDADSIFTNYFNVLNPKRVDAKNDPLKIEVSELPSQGQPKGFQGAVGDITLQSKLDKNEVKVGEPVTLLVRLEGRANFASIEPPVVQWPEGLELFDSKSLGRSSQAGVGEKSFEYIVIPRKPGDFKLPPLEFSFFNPRSHAYETKRMPALSLKATGSAMDAATGAPQQGSGADWQSARSSTKSPQMVTGHAELRYLKLAPIEPSKIEQLGLWRWWVGLAALGLVWFLGQVAYHRVGQILQRARDPDRRAGSGGEALALRELRDQAKRIHGESTYGELSTACAALETLMFERMSRILGTPSRALTRDDLRARLGTRWASFEEAFKFADDVRYSKDPAQRVSEADLKTLQRLVPWMAQQHS